MGRWPLSHEGGGVLADDSVPGEPAASLVAECGRRTIPTQRNGLRRLNEVRFVWVTAPGTLESWPRIRPVAARMVSVCWPVSSADRDDHLLPSPDAAIAESCGERLLRPELLVSVWLQKPSLHQRGQELVASLAVRVVVLVPPNCLGFFFENQQCGRFGQSLVFAPKLLL